MWSRNVSTTTRCIMFLMLIAAIPFIVAQEPAPDKARSPGQALSHPIVENSLDLSYGTPIRGALPDGSAFVNLLSFKDGALRLCDDPYFYTSTDKEHLAVKVIEVRNPGSDYPDFRLPISRSRPDGRVMDADSKLVVRSASMIETNDPAELNLIRTGDDANPVKDENAPVANGAVTGLIRWMGRRSPAKDPGTYSGYAKDAEIIARNFGTSEADHYGALFLQIFDYRYKKFGNRPGVMLVMKPGVRIGDLDESPGESKTGSMFEVDSMDARPIVFRRPDLSVGEPVDVAWATGRGGDVAAATNTLAQIRAIPVSEGPLRSRLEIQTNSGDKLQGNWILPVPMVHVTCATNQSVPSGEAVPLHFDRERFDSSDMHGKDENSTQLVCTLGGCYVATGAVEFAPDGRGSRQLVIRRNGRETVAALRVPALIDETTQLTVMTPPLEMAPGDYVELLVRQTSGTPLEIPANGEQPPSFSLTRAG